jgi:hypothetical protein
VAAAWPATRWTTSWPWPGLPRQCRCFLPPLPAGDCPHPPNYPTALQSKKIYGSLFKQLVCQQRNSHYPSPTEC